MRIAAYTWLLRRGDAAALETLARALDAGSEPEAVADHLRTVSLIFPDELLAAWPSVVAQQPRRKEPAPRGPAAQPRTHVSARALGNTGVELTPLVLSGANELGGAGLAEAVEAGCTSFFWEPGYDALTRFLRLRRSQRFTLVSGTYHSGAKSIRRDVDSHLRALGRDVLDVFLLFWVRSAARLDAENLDALMRLRDAGKIRTFGFSTHLRDVAADAVERDRWPVVMIRHSAAHPGVEDRFLPVAARAGTGVLAFTATCYGRLLQRVEGTPEGFALPTAPECYRYVLSQPGVSAAVFAPRKYHELVDDLSVLDALPLEAKRMEVLREHGRRVRAHSQRFNALVRQAGNP